MEHPVVVVSASVSHAAGYVRTSRNFVFLVKVEDVDVHVVILLQH